MFQELAENIREVFWIRTPDEVLYASSAFEEIWGISRENLRLGLEFMMNRVHPDDRERVLASCRRHQSRGAFNEEYRFILADGQVRWLWTRAFPIWQNGRVVRTVGVSEDITERKLAEERLQNSKNTLGAVFDGISDPLMLLDAGMCVLKMNKAARLLYGIPLDSEPVAYGKPCYSSLMGRGEPCEGCDFRRFFRERVRSSFERRDFRSPGSIEQVTVFPVAGENGGDGSVVIHVRDVTEAKRIEGELIRADKMISLGVLVSGVAHEINNPNSFIMLNTPLLHDAWESVTPILEEYYDENGDFAVGGLPYSEMREEMDKLFHGLLEGSRRIDRIVRELKRFSGSEGVSADEVVHINDVLRNASSLVANLVRKSTDAFSIRCGENLPALRGSAQKLEQVVVNLIRNACEALPDRSKAVGVSSGYDQASGRVLLEVRDEGVGIPDEILPRIMDPFFTTKKSRGGTGLGLSVSANIAREHGGTIQVETRRGKGTTFTVVLPTRKGFPRLPKIVVAAGDGADRDEIVRILTQYRKYIVIGASSGVDACVRMGTERPDLLVLDVNLPDMDGVEVCRSMRGIPELSGVGVVVLSEIPPAPPLESLAKIGFVSVVSKPVLEREMLAAVESALAGAPVVRKPQGPGGPDFEAGSDGKGRMVPPLPACRSCVVVQHETKARDE